MWFHIWLRHLKRLNAWEFLLKRVFCRKLMPQLLVSHCLSLRKRIAVFIDFFVIHFHPASLLTMRSSVTTRLCASDRAQLAEVFEDLDHTSDGFIHKEDIRRALDKLDIVASDAQIM